MGNDLRDNTILFAKRHIQKVFGVEPNILLGQEKWLHTDENGILWCVKAYRFFSYDWTEKGGEVLAQRSFNNGSVVTFGYKKLYTGTLWNPRQPDWDLEFPMIKDHAGRAQKVAEWVYLNLLSRGTEMPLTNSRSSSAPPSGHQSATEHLSLLPTREAGTTSLTRPLVRWRSR